MREARLCLVVFDDFTRLWFDGEVSVTLRTFGLVAHLKQRDGDDLLEGHREVRKLQRQIVLDNRVAAALLDFGIDLADRQAVPGVQNVSQNCLKVSMFEEQRPQERDHFFLTAIDHVMVTRSTAVWRRQMPWLGIFPASPGLPFRLSWGKSERAEG